MDTINSMAKTAANVVWGSNTTDGKEPVSGHQGDVSKGEPFDKGNVEGMIQYANVLYSSCRLADCCLA